MTKRTEKVEGEVPIFVVFVTLEQTILVYLLGICWLSRRSVIVVH